MRNTIANGRTLDLSSPRVMGILNVTPDSFSDGGKFFAADSALFQAQKMLQDGAYVIDVGGESTRPGAQEVSLSQELDRVIPVIESLTAEFDVAVSVDTSKPEVMTAAVAAGAVLINDVRALREPGAVAAAAATGAYVCLMHMQGQPRSMQLAPAYEDVVREVNDFLIDRVAVCEQAGIARSRILLDPGFGFGKNLQHNLSLLRNIDAVVALGLPVLVGISRKSMFGQLMNLSVEQRLIPSVAAAVMLVMRGARLVRAHDVQETVQALAVCSAVLAMENEGDVR
ncbi:MAG: dihydropteroate synthase [Gammaproteobacteria bacterium]|nr:dihydropteroate synthase [Gammaproteobacteria bacterium]